MSSLTDILDLVGALDDAPGDDVPRERYRRYLVKSVTSIGQVRDYIHTCLAGKGPQFDRALQDLVNHAAQLMGFEVEFGRYQGVQGQIGHDGLWLFEDLSLVVEVKTTDAYTIKTASLVGYIDQLISAKRISNWDQALGLYVVGRADSALKQLEDAIIAEKRTHQLRVSTIESVLDLGELVEAGHLSQREAVTLLRPSGVVVDEIVELLSRVTSETDSVVVPPLGGTPPDPQEAVGTGAGPATYVLTPVRGDKKRSAQEIITALLAGGWYVFGDRTPCRKTLKPGDRICFYEVGNGIVAEAVVAGCPERKQAPGIRDPARYPWRFPIREARTFFDAPVVIDAGLRSRLDAFAGRDPHGMWSWFVQPTHAVSEHDFMLLTGGPQRG